MHPGVWCGCECVGRQGERGTAWQKKNHVRSVKTRRDRPDGVWVQTQLTQTRSFCFSYIAEGWQLPSERHKKHTVPKIAFQADRPAKVSSAGEKWPMGPYREKIHLSRLKRVLVRFTRFKRCSRYNSERKRAEKELGLESENWRKSFPAAQPAGKHTIEQYETAWEPM